MIYIRTSTGKMIRTRDLRIDTCRMKDQIKTCDNLAGKIQERDAAFIRARKRNATHRWQVKHGLVKERVDPYID